MVSNQEAKIGGYSIEDIDSCVGEKGEQYRDRFEDLESGHRRFNWPSAIFGQYWLAYRMMWKEALALMAASLVFEMAVQAALTGLHMAGANRRFYEIVIMGTAGAALVALMGFLGDRLYWRHVRASIGFYSRQETYEQNRSEVRAQLRKEGGTSAIMLAACILVQMVARTLLEKIAPGLLWSL